ncbi:MAG: hypothetical protein WC680_10365 [Sulfuricurvum sp.]|jgi:hypothetical protein
MFVSRVLSSFLFSTILLVSSTASVFTDNNVPESNDEWLLEKQLDNFQKYWSRKVLAFSSELDQIGLNQFDDNKTENILADVNSSEYVQQSDLKQVPYQIPLPYDPFIKRGYAEPQQVPYQISLPFDAFFKDDIYLDKTNKSYIKVTGGYQYNHLGQSTAVHNISARIRLPKTNKRLHLFINEKQETPKKATRNQIIEQEASTDAGIGIKYYFPLMYKNFFSHLSIGLSGITNPYTKTYLEYLMLFTDLQIRFNQNFKYSQKNKFEEWTDVYFEQKLSDQDLLRLFLQRSTDSETVGMKYMSQLSYTRVLEKESSYMYYIAINGRTKDITNALYQNGLNPQEGVYNYSAGIVWRQQFFKDYLYYQIEPILSYHEEYNYKPNYLLRFTVDIFFESKK